MLFIASRCFGVNDICSCGGSAYVLSEEVKVSESKERKQLGGVFSDASISSFGISPRGVSKPPRFSSLLCLTKIALLSFKSYKCSQDVPQSIDDDDDYGKT